MIEPSVRKHLRELTNTPGLAGHEQRVAHYLAHHLQPHTDTLHTDTLGNVISTINGTDPDAPTILLFAHMDSLGFIVRKIEPDGYIRIHRLGGIPIKILPATPVTLTTPQGDIPGIIATKAHHVTPPHEKTTVTPIEDLYIDIGTTNKQQTHDLGIQPGTPVTYEGRYVELAGDRVNATFLDNRAGCVTILETARKLAERRPASTVHVVGTVQEEFNLRGALPVAQTLRPDIAICIDLSLAADTPDLAGESDIAMGEGPSMNLYSFHGRGTLNGLLPHPALVRAVERVAADAAIPLQRNVFMGGLTDASYVQLAGEGVATIDLGFPMRYSHTPAELCDLGDLSRLVDLLAAFVPSIDANFDFAR